MENTVKKSSLENRLEIFSVILLSVATVASAWCAAESNLWTSSQLGRLADFDAYGRLALEKNTRAGQMRIVDVQLFSQYANALIEGNAKLADFYYARFRPETRPALEAWNKMKPLNNPSAPPSPFSMPEYKLALDDEVAQIRIKADQAYKEGQENNATSDRYVLLMTLFSTVLFFAGIAPRFSKNWMRGMFLFLGAFIWLISFVIMLKLPVTLTAFSGGFK